MASQLAEELQRLWTSELEPWWQQQFGREVGASFNAQTEPQDAGDGSVVLACLKMTAQPGVSLATPSVTTVSKANRSCKWQRRAIACLPQHPHVLPFNNFPPLYVFPSPLCPPSYVCLPFAFAPFSGSLPKPTMLITPCLPLPPSPPPHTQIPIPFLPPLLPPHSGWWQFLSFHWPPSFCSHPLPLPLSTTLLPFLSPIPILLTALSQAVGKLVSSILKGEAPASPDHVLYGVPLLAVTCRASQPMACALSRHVAVPRLLLRAAKLRAVSVPTLLAPLTRCAAQPFRPLPPSPRSLIVPRALSSTARLL